MDRQLTHIIKKNSYLILDNVLLCPNWSSMWESIRCLSVSFLISRLHKAFPVLRRTRPEGSLLKPVGAVFIGFGLGIFFVIILWFPWYSLQSIAFPSWGPLKYVCSNFLVMRTVVGWKKYALGRNTQILQVVYIVMNQPFSFSYTQDPQEGISINRYEVIKKIRV